MRRQGKVQKGRRSLGIPLDANYWRNNKRGSSRAAYRTIRAYTDGRWKLMSQHGSIFETTLHALELYGYNPQTTRPSFFPKDKELEAIRGPW